MSVIWFLITYCMYCEGCELTDIAIMMIAIFYVGDCILWSRRK